MILTIIPIAGNFRGGPIFAVFVVKQHQRGCRCESRDKKIKMKLGGEVNHQTWNVVGISINLFVASMTELDGLSYDGFLLISKEI